MKQETVETVLDNIKNTIWHYQERAATIKLAIKNKQMTSADGKKMLKHIGTRVTEVRDAAIDARGGFMGDKLDKLEEEIQEGHRKVLDLLT